MLDSLKYCSGWEPCVSMTRDTWLGRAQEGDWVQLGAIPQAGWAGHPCGFNKICPQPRPEATRVGVGESSRELVSVVHC